MSLASLGSCLHSAPFLHLKENGNEQCSMRVELRLARQNPLPQMDHTQALPPIAHWLPIRNGLCKPRYMPVPEV